jgi:hypothetical protein
MSLLALTSFYNPLKGSLRRLNYQCFRRHLGVPLLTVEWAPHGNFELSHQDADELIQVSGGDLLWQKERLLNMGLARALELGYDKVAFLDSDIVFKDPEWHEEVSEGLNHCEFMQCFATVNHLPQGNHQDLSRAALFELPFEYQSPSFASLISQGQNLFTAIGHDFRGRSSPGLATAIHIGRLKGWTNYEGNIVGGGDFAMLSAISRNTEEMFAVRPYSSSHRRHLLEWAALQASWNIRTRASSGQICHLWHGLRSDRQYVQRYSILADCDYDPASDIDMDSPGPLRFVAERHKLRHAVESYIGSRKDG